MQPLQQQSLGSDNHSGILPEAMAAIVNANVGHVPAYGGDSYTYVATQAFKAHFGDAIDVHFVFNGTAANVLSLHALMPSYGSVLCSADAHISMDECAAPERIVGCRVQAVAAPHGKLTTDLIAPYLIRFGDQHYASPRMLSLTQCTEVGTVYQPDELRALVDLAHQRNLLVHMDGSRLVNAAVSMGLPLAAFTTDVGIDALSFGGTKHGLMGCEAVVIFGEARKKACDFAYIRKQDMQLNSKMRYVSAQFTAFLTDDLWRRGATHALAMAKRLEAGVRDVPQVHITHPVQANAVFARVPKAWVKALREEAFFYVWNENTFEVRWMTSFDTTQASIDRFIAKVRSLST